MICVHIVIQYRHSLSLTHILFIIKQTKYIRKDSDIYTDKFRYT